MNEERIHLGGLSQGYAVALMALLVGGRRLGGVVGISGWLPFLGALVGARPGCP